MKIIIWGAGVIARTIVNGLKSNVELIGFIDNDASKQGEKFCNKIIYSPQNKDIYEECDYILLALQSYAQDVYEQLTINLGVDPNKILSFGPFWDSQKLENNYRTIKNIVDFDESKDEFSLNPSNFILHRKMEWDRYLGFERSNSNKRLFSSDYTRFRTFELCADELHKISSDEIKKAAVAEVGVFRGDFSVLINEKFNNQKLYLFDTFEGFNSQEYLLEKAKEDLNSENVNCFRDTSVDLVLNRMPYRENCIIKKGYFPATTLGCENETFSFVSIDVDLFDSILNAMKFFYPRLVKGGYLFVHEFNHGHYSGVKKAIEIFEGEFGILNKVPIADSNGTLVITK